MHVQEKPEWLATDYLLDPAVRREHLDETWVGIGAAIDWIAMRGQPMSKAMYWVREDKAAEQLVAQLSNLPPAIAEALVRGAAEEQPGPLVPIPSGIWRQTATSDANDQNQPYRLIGVDIDCEWEGAILGVQVTGYRRVQIRTDFLRDTWPEFEMETKPSPIRRVVAMGELRQLIEKIVAMTPGDLVPLSQREICSLVKGILPASSRDVVRQCVRDIHPNVNSKPGPRGPRDPSRKMRVGELRGKLIAAQLRD